MECLASEPSPLLCPDLPTRRRQSGRSGEQLESKLAELMGLESATRLLELELAELELVQRELELPFACSCFLQWPIG